MKAKFYFLSYIGIPLSTLYLCQKASLAKENLTYVANVLPYLMHVTLLSLWISVFCFFQFTDLIKKIEYDSKLLKGSAFLFSLLFPLAALTPYFKENLFISSIHVLFSFGGSILFFIIFHFLLWQIHVYDPLLFQKLFIPYMIMLFGCFLIFISFNRVNSLLEIYFITCFVYIFYKANQKQ